MQTARGQPPKRRRSSTALAPYDLAYVEQPFAAGDFEAMAEPCRPNRPMPLMLDESLASDGRRRGARRSRSGFNLQGHLKLVKLGGLAPAHRGGWPSVTAPAFPS